jgi:hypothetical protein
MIQMRKSAIGEDAKRAEGRIGQRRPRTRSGWTDALTRLSEGRGLKEASEALMAHFTEEPRVLRTACLELRYPTALLREACAFVSVKRLGRRPHL